MKYCPAMKRAAIPLILLGTLLVVVVILGPAITSIMINLRK
jgi:hypothetical protein